jgi:origin recognition complex subunit 4
MKRKAPDSRGAGIACYQHVIRQQISELHTPHAEVLHGMGDAWGELHDLLHRTIVHSENQSVLLVGHSGSGKSLLLRHVLQSLSKQHGTGDAFVQVNLNGIVQTDDEIAMREITRQLAVDHAASGKSSTFQSNIAFLVDVLRERHAVHLPVIFVLDEFDKFAGRSKQKLLYNLFDLMQQPSVQIAVVGITSKIDTIELLEKRIKSRFSHRQILLLHPSVEDLSKILKDALTVATDTEATAEHKQYLAEANRRWHQLITNEKYMKQLVKRCHALGKSVRWMFRLALIAVSGLGDAYGTAAAARQAGQAVGGGSSSEDDSVAQPTVGGEAYLTYRRFEAAMQLMAPDNQMLTFEGVTLPELSILLSIKRLEDQQMSKYNFEIVYTEYRKFVVSDEGSMSINVYSKDVLFKVGLSRNSHTVVPPLSSFSC